MRPGDRLVIPSADCPFGLTISRQQWTGKHSASVLTLAEANS
jgi:hypothetical protein